MEEKLKVEAKEIEEEKYENFDTDEDEGQSKKRIKKEIAPLYFYLYY